MGSVPAGRCPVLQRAQSDIADGQSTKASVEVLDHPKHSVTAARFHRADGNLDPSFGQPANQFLGLGIAFGKRQVFGAVAVQSLDLLAMNLTPMLGRFGIGRLEAALDLPLSALENHSVNVGAP